MHFLFKFIPIYIQWNKFKKKVHLVGSYYANVSRYTAHIMSNLIGLPPYNCRSSSDSRLVSASPDYKDFKMIPFNFKFDVPFVLRRTLIRPPSCNSALGSV